MSVSVGEDGTIYTMVKMKMPLARRSKTVWMGTRMEVSPRGVRVVTTMPGMLAKNQQILTTIEFTPEDLVTIFRAKLAVAESSEKIKQALLDIPVGKAVDWTRYFLGKLG